MTTSDNLTDEQRRGLETVEKLLRLAGKNPNEHEAAAATAKAMAMLADLNLSLASVDESGEGGGRRAEEKLMGGFYEFERDLVSRVADLNFVYCWHQQTWVKREKIDAKSERIRDPFRRTHILRGQFKLVGRVRNIQATRVMADYLLSTIERLTRERLREDGVTESINTQMRSRWAVSYREGIAERICEKLWGRRQERLREEREEAERAARQAGMAGASTGTTLTLASLRRSEEDANRDFVMGEEGYSARMRAERAARAERERQAREEYTRWAAEHPEEARKMEEERRREERKRSRTSWNAGTGVGKQRDWGAYRAGYERGDSVGIDQQAGERKVAGALS